MYSPSDDSFFFAEFLKKEFTKNPNIKYLDMGTGSGILSKTAKECGVKHITASDINPEAVKTTSKNIKTIQSDLFENINEKFDIITFNAPYLPEDKNEPEDSKIETTGGKKGDEISLRFVKQAKQHLKKKGKILLLISSHTPLERLKKFNPKIKSEKHLFFEKLYILEFK